MTRSGSVQTYGRKECNRYCRKESEVPEMRRAAKKNGDCQAKRLALILYEQSPPRRMEEKRDRRTMGWGHR